MDKLTEEQLSLLKTILEQDGSLMLKEFITFLADTNNNAYQGLSDEDYAHLYKELDLNKNGKFEFKEFMKNLMANTTDEPEPEPEPEPETEPEAEPETEPEPEPEAEPETEPEAEPETEPEPDTTLSEE